MTYWRQSVYFQRLGPITSCSCYLISGDVNNNNDARRIRFRSRSYILLTRTDGRFCQTANLLLCLLTIFAFINGYKKMHIKARYMQILNYMLWQNTLSQAPVNVHPRFEHINMLFWKLYYAVYCLIWGQNGLVVFGELFICHIQTSSWGQVTSVNRRGSLSSPVTWYLLD